MTADFIIINPPYDGDLHLQFLQAGLKCLKDTGRMVIVEPSSWLTSIKDKDLYKEVRQSLRGRVRSVRLENLNIPFGTDIKQTFSITYIDNTYNSDCIEFSNCGIKDWVNDLNDCNHIGRRQLIQGILDKCKAGNSIHKEGDMLSDHFIKMKAASTFKSHEELEKEIERLHQAYPGEWFTRIMNFQMNSLGSNLPGTSNNKCAENPEKKYFLNYTQPNGELYSWALETEFGIKLDTYIHTISMNLDITQEIPTGKRFNKKLNSYNPSDCIHDPSRGVLENLQWASTHNRLFMFLAMCMQYDEHNNTMAVVPWVFGGRHTDEELEREFRLSADEKRLIRETVDRYTVTNPWWRRYMTGDTTIDIENIG
jgi:hypothetical protein